MVVRDTPNKDLKWEDPGFTNLPLYRQMPYNGISITESEGTLVGQAITF